MIQTLKADIFCQRNILKNAIEIHIAQKFDGKLWVAQPIVISAIDEGSISEPSISVSMDAAQMLMDQLWRCGLRPTEGTGSAGSLAATERHLHDLQVITKALLKKQGCQL